MPAAPVFTITRSFNATRDAMWKAWTTPEQMAQWFGPKGFTCHVPKLDLRPGGITHSYLRAPDGTEMWGKFVYREITPPSHLAWTHSFADADGSVTRHPFSPTWPLELSTTIDFAEKDGKTTITLTWTPHNATDEEIKTFAGGMDSMQQGWTGTFDQLEEFLQQAKAA